nr:unnamed protein product [Callosobruchus analis]
MENRSDVKVSKLLSESHRRAAPPGLPLHRRLRPFMAGGHSVYRSADGNFDTSISNTSFIKYLDNGTSFTVEWERVTLQDKPDHEFTFQSTLFKNGDIVFVYKEVPIFVEDIAEIHHPVKVGLSDAYIMDQEVLFTRRKTIFEYDRVNINKTEIRNWTSVYLAALPTTAAAPPSRTFLLSLDGRGQILAHVVQQLGGGVGRRSAYEEEGGPRNALLSRLQRQDKVGTSSIVAVLFLVGTIFGMVVWVFYAYRNPHTFSGQILIRRCQPLNLSQLVGGFTVFLTALPLLCRYKNVLLSDFSFSIDQANGVGGGERRDIRQPRFTCDPVIERKRIELYSGFSADGS